MALVPKQVNQYDELEALPEPGPDEGWILYDPGDGNYKKIRPSLLGGGGGPALPALPSPNLAPLVVNSQTQITASWNQVTGNNGYEIQRSLNNTTWGNSQTVGVGVLTAAITGLTQNTLYYVRVRALGAPGVSSNSPWSNVQQATTQAAGGYQPETTAFEAGLGSVGAGWSQAEKDAADALIVVAKNIGWAKFDIIYGFFGTVLAGTYLNLKNPANTNAAFRMSVSGAAPTANNGLQKGATTILDTNYNYSVQVTDPNDFHQFDMWTGATGDSGSGVQGGTFGDAGVITSGKYSGANFLASQGGKQYFEAGIGTDDGDVLITRTGSGNSNSRAYFNGVERTVFSTAGGDVPNADIYVGGINQESNQTSPTMNGVSKRIGFSVGKGLTPAEAATWRAAWITFKTALGR